MVGLGERLLRLVPLVLCGPRVQQPPRGRAQLVRTRAVRVAGDRLVVDDRVGADLAEHRQVLGDRGQDQRLRARRPQLLRDRLTHAAQELPRQHRLRLVRAAVPVKGGLAGAGRTALQLGFGQLAHDVLERLGDVALRQLLDGVAGGLEEAHGLLGHRQHVRAPGALQHGDQGAHVEVVVHRDGLRDLDRDPHRPVEALLREDDQASALLPPVRRVGRELAHRGEHGLGVVRSEAGGLQAGPSRLELLGEDRGGVSALGRRDVRGDVEGDCGSRLRIDFDDGVEVQRIHSSLGVVRHGGDLLNGELLLAAACPSHPSPE